MICNFCGRDLSVIFQDNVSLTPGVIVCEDCVGELAGKYLCSEEEYNEFEEDQD